MEMKERTLITIALSMLFVLIMLNSLWEIIDGLWFGKLQQVVTALVIGVISVFVAKVIRFFLRCWTFDDDDED